MHIHRSRASLNLPPLNRWFCGLLRVNGRVYVGISKPNLPVKKNFWEKTPKPLHWRFEDIWGMSLLMWHFNSQHLMQHKKNIKKGWSSYAMVYSDIDFTHAASSSSAFSPNFKIASDHIEARHLGKPINTEGTAPTSQACSTERCQIILERLKSIDLYPSIVSWSFRQVQIIPGTMSGIPCL